MIADRWYALEVTIQQQAQEAVQYGLMEAGALGTDLQETGEDSSRVTAYFASVPDLEHIRNELLESLRIYGLSSATMKDMGVREVKNQDWLGEWKKTWKPIEVGERFLIAPPWSNISDARNRIVIRIEPGMAFGTGTHETTRLCLAAIERYFEGGSFIDVGTGTGILAIAAAKLFPKASITAYDTDDEAVTIACNNAVANGITTNIDFRVGSVDEATPSANMVCANLTAPIILDLLPALTGVSCGRLILSGLLSSQVETVTDRLRELGINDTVEICQDGEWVALVV